VDDGSTDRTLEILARQERAGKIRLIRQRNAGAPAARNAGLEATTAPLVQFLDADDLIGPEKLARQARILWEAGSDRTFLAGAFRRSAPSGWEQTHIPITGDPWIGLLSSRLGTTSSNLFRRAALEMVDGWNEGAASSQEYDLMFRMLKAGCISVPDLVSDTEVRIRDRGSISFGGNQVAKWSRFIQLRLDILEYLRGSGLATAEREHAAFQRIFSAARDAFSLDPKAAADFVAEALPPDFSPPGSAYRRLYRVLGFPAAERIYRVARRLGIRS